MTPIETATTVQPSSSTPQTEPWEQELAAGFASRLAKTVRHRTPQQIAEQLLKRLLTERESRRLQNLNHWPEHAPSFLRQMVRSLSNKEAWRRRKIEQFFRTDHAKACVFATGFLPTSEEVEDAVGDAFLKLQRNETSIRYFYRTLRNICVDRYRQLGNAYDSVEGMIEINQAYRHGAAGELPTEIELRIDRARPQDPLTLLMDSRQTRVKRLLVGRAKKSPKWHSARRKKWAQGLQPATAEKGGSNE